MNEPSIFFRKIGSCTRFPSKIAKKSFGALSNILFFRDPSFLVSSLDSYVPQQASNEAIRSALLGNSSCLISRFGSNELITTVRYYYKKTGLFNPSLCYTLYALGLINEFWYDDPLRKLMHNNAGFFPTDDKSLDAFAELMLKCANDIDILGCWQDRESILKPFLKRANLIHFKDIQPYRHNNPWTSALEGKKVLVISPFKDSIPAQYERRSKLFSDPLLLPDFELIMMEAVQTHAGGTSKFSSWFDAYQHMCSQLDKMDFDIALIGAGAYGMPLGYHIKRLGKKAIHIGGTLQIMFGIRGKRWDDLAEYQHLYNEHWVRPLSSEIPPQPEVVEDSCYW